MDTLIWKDMTSFSRGETDRTPRTWQMNIGSIRLIVTRKWLGRDYSATGWSRWCVECDPFLRYEPSIEDVDSIKSAALDELKKRLLKHVELLEAQS